MRSLAILLLVAFPAIVLSQPSQAPPIKQAPPTRLPQQAPPVKEGKKAVADSMKSHLTYAEAVQMAAGSGKPLVVFVGIPARPIPGAVTVSVGKFSTGEGNERLVVSTTNQIIVSIDTRNGLWLNSNVSDAEILRHLGRVPEVSQSAVPFEPSAAPEPPTAAVAAYSPPEVADASPGISRAETQAVMAMWPKGVPLGEGVFFRLPQKYQNLYTMNNGRSRFTDINAWSQEGNELDVSGGMQHVSRGAWRNVTRLEVPKGQKIKVYKEDTDVRAFSLVPKWRWTFPTGTRAYDILVNNADNKIFEVRLHEKLEGGWDDGTIYRPDGDRFRAGRLPVDGNLVPHGYTGKNLACNQCHSQVGALLETAGRIYRTPRRGDDGRFSWHPFTENGTIDTRWPIEMASGVSQPATAGDIGSTEYSDAAYGAAPSFSRRRIGRR